jgi:hypothetical protein
MQASKIWITALVAVTALGACANDSKKPKVSSKDKPAAKKAASFATRTPPTGATAMGKQSAPRAGSVTIPVDNVDVYQFSTDIDGNGSSDALYWALGPDATYIWGQITLPCTDDEDRPTGETGTAELVYEGNAAGYGWMLSIDSCGLSAVIGCSGTSEADEVCGSCAFHGDLVTCSSD